MTCTRNPHNLVCIDYDCVVAAAMLCPSESPPGVTLAHARNGRDKWQRVCSLPRTGDVVDIAAAKKLSESTPLVNKRELVLAKHPNL